MRKGIKIWKRVLGVMLSAILMLDVYAPVSMVVLAAEVESGQKVSMDKEKIDDVLLCNTDTLTSGDGENEKSDYVGGSIETPDGNRREMRSITFADDDIASGTYEDITWVIDAEGKLTVEGTGEVHGLYEHGVVVPWLDESSSIVSAEIKVSGLKDAGYMFYKCNNLISVDLSEFDTSSVTRMDAMFYGCSNLISVDLSGFDTSEVTDMSEMFYGCRKLTSLNLNGFDTSNVKDMSSMFVWCDNLTGIDVSGFETSNVTDMSSMFYGCRKLTSLDISEFDMSKVTRMYDMFSECGIETLYTPCWVVKNSGDLLPDEWQDISGKNYTTLPEGLDYSILLAKSKRPDAVQPELTVKLLKKKYVLESEIKPSDILVKYRSADGTTCVLCDGYSLNDVDMTILGEKELVVTYQVGNDILQATDILTVIENIPIAGGTYKNVTWEIDAAGHLTVEGTGEFIVLKHEEFASYWVALWHEECESIISAEINVSGAGNASRMFAGCGNLIDLDMSRFDTSSVTKMSSMFSGCSSLTSLDMSGFDTSNVTDMDFMFSDCSNLTSLDISGFDTSNVTGMRRMFEGCSKLTSLDTSGFDTNNVTAMYYMFDGCRNLISLDMSGFNTSRVTDMEGMFSNCDSLTSIYTPYWVKNGVYMPHTTDDQGEWQDISGKVYYFLPENLESSIFLRKVTKDAEPDAVQGKLAVKLLKDIYVRGSKVKKENVRVKYYGLDGIVHIISDGYTLSDVDMNTIGEKEIVVTYQDGDNVFSTTAVLTVIEDIPIASDIYKDIKWKIDAVGDLTIEGVGEVSESAFDDTRAPWYPYRNDIKSAEIKVTGMKDASYLFNGCSNLTSVDLSGFDTKSVIDMGGMFFGCSRLTYIDVSGFNTSNVTDMFGMFQGCKELTELDVSGFDTKNVIDMGEMFDGCDCLNNIDVRGFNTSNVTRMFAMFRHCISLTSLDVSEFDTSKVTDMEDMFSFCNKLTNLDVSSFNTSRVTNMRGMFSNCASLVNIDVSGFDTARVTDMGGMFSDCDNITTIDLHSFDTARVTNMSAMFSNCDNITALDLRSFDTSNVTSMYMMFMDCGKLENVDLRGFNTSKVTNMSYMFQECRKLKSLDLSWFDMSEVKKCTEMLWYLWESSLTTIYTPYNIPEDLTVELWWDDTWYDAYGNVYSEFPKGLDHSILITRERIPDEAVYEELIVILV